MVVYIANPQGVRSSLGQVGGATGVDENETKVITLP